VLHLRNLNSMQRAFALGAAGLALTAAPAVAQPDVTLHRVAATPTSQAIDLRSPDAVDAADNAVDAADSPTPATSSLAGTTSSSPEVQNAAEPVKADNGGLDWGSAGIGAGAVVAVSLFGLAGVALTHRARMHPVP
jgi:hypothetical protein